MKSLDSVRVVLMEPEHPGNIGAAARAMANMGLARLVLVAPRDFPSPVATARASGAEELLDRALVVDTLDEAIAECSLVVGATARERSVRWPSTTPEDAMGRLVAGPHEDQALLFGRESSGLTNEELERCQLLVRIPVSEASSSLNLGSAVMVVLYELRRQALAGRPTAAATDATDSPPCTADEMRHFYAHLGTLLDKSGFGGPPSPTRLRVFKRMFNRAAMLRSEVQLMRGLFGSIEGRLDADSRAARDDPPGEPSETES